MDEFTLRTLLKSFLDELRSFRQEVHAVRIDQNAAANQEKKPLPIEIRSELRLPSSITSHYDSQRHERESKIAKVKKGAKIFLEVTAVGSAVTLAVLTYRTLKQIQTQTSSIIRNAGSAEKGSTYSRMTLLASQRAYVFVPLGFYNIIRADCQDIGKKCLGFSLALENGGNTPAIEELHRVNSNAPAYRDLPKHFKYPDNPIYRQAFPNSPVLEAPAVLAPHSRIGASLLTVPEDVLQRVNVGNSHVYFWGWVSFKDVFGCEHKTEFCQEIVYYTPAPVSVSFSNCSEHNCIDAQCADYKPTPNDLCSTVIPK